MLEVSNGRFLVNKEFFQNVVELHNSKGMFDVVSMSFNGSTMNLVVCDYCDPTIEYVLNVIDTVTADAELSEARK